MKKIGQTAESAHTYRCSCRLNACHYVAYVLLKHTQFPVLVTNVGDGLTHRWVASTFGIYLSYLFAVTFVSRVFIKSCSYLLYIRRQSMG